jgi:transposase InsO family protein
MQARDNGPISRWLAGPLGSARLVIGMAQYIIENIEEAQDHATLWLWTYNNDRPNMGIGGITPAMKLKMAA